QMKGKAKQKWAKLTDDDLTYIDGKREQLLGRIQERYGIQKDVAEKELKDWERML
ncbi:MAG TPA: CsbD family protein, partial [Dongiaceae bacterium]|nr:CsbD family protein [Dongiaceae bacterium]